MEEIYIDISPDGNSVTVEGKGIKGPDCESLTKDIEQALGAVEKKRRTAEYNQRPATRRKATL